MPWCPKCKSEYREGFTICADCGCQLVEEEPVSLLPLTFGEREQMEALKEFLIYSGIRETELEEKEGEEQTELLVPPEKLEKAAAAVRVFFSQVQSLQAEGEMSEKDKAAEDTDPGAEDWQSDSEGQAADQVREVQTARRTLGGSSLYQDSSQRAEDNRSSAWILLAVGILGLTLVVLGIVGVIPLQLGNPYLFYGVMTAVFLLFLVAGAVSMKNAKFFSGKAESENTLRSTMLDWCRENLRADEIDRNVSAAGASEEVLYFSRTSLIKEKLNHQFVNLDQDFLDKFVDDYVYGMVFEEKA